MSDEPDAPPESPADAATGPASTRPCPICSAPIVAGSAAETKYRPFCSRACSDIDLLRWLRGSYVVAGTGVEDDEDGETGRTAPPADPSDDTRH